MNLVTIQTGPSGRIVKRLLIEEGLDIQRELYLSLLVDRETARVIFMAAAPAAWRLKKSPEGSQRHFFTIDPPGSRLAALSSA